MFELDKALEGIKKMSLQKGDILILDQHAAKWFAMLPPQVMDEWVRGVGFDVPVIVDITGQGVQKMSRQELVGILENMPI